MPQTSGFRSAKQILVVSFATQARAFILSDRNIFYTPGGRTTAGSNAPGAFLVSITKSALYASDELKLLGHHQVKRNLFKTSVSFPLMGRKIGQITEFKILIVFAS